MKFRSAILFLLLALAPIHSNGATFLVKMANFSFTPSDITVDIGDTIIWSNTVSTGHDTVCQGVWQSALLPRGGTFSFTFNVGAGRYNYICTPHVSFGMVGSVTVRPPANLPPTATITSPPNGATFKTTDTITVNVDARDDSAVAKIDLLVDRNVVKSQATGPFQITLPAGTHTLVARATDDKGLTGDSPPITVNVQPPDQPPTVLITSPTNNAVFAPTSRILVAASVTAEAPITKLELLVNNTIAATQTTGPFQITLPEGAYTLVVRATDNRGLAGDSPPININVRTPDQPPLVAFVTPLNGQSFDAPASVPITVTASHASGIVRVDFLANGNALGADTNAPYEMVASLSQIGNYTLTARALSVSGLTGEASVDIVVREHIPVPPQILIARPTDGSFVSLSSNILIAASTFDSDGFVTNVNFFEGSSLLGSVATSTPTNRFELLTPLSEGVHTIFAIATDNSGLTATSTPPSSFTVLMRPEITSSNLVSSNILRLSFFGTSGFPYVFEYTTNMVTWVPFLTSQLYRRILFVDAPIVPGEIRFYRARSPGPPPDATAAEQYLHLKVQQSNGGSPPIPTL